MFATKPKDTEQDTKSTDASSTGTNIHNSGRTFSLSEIHKSNLISSPNVTKKEHSYVYSFVFKTT